MIPVDVPTRAMKLKSCLRLHGRNLRRHPPSQIPNGGWSAVDVSGPMDTQKPMDAMERWMNIGGMEEQGKTKNLSGRPVLPRCPTEKSEVVSESDQEASLYLFNGAK